ncbi:MAG: sigma-70 family RNA polymerase sigma factor [Phycisphaerales bacterium]|nr:sigma-70 family RNA polymerase sigma factor [Phycisphaerales bacterium]MCB9855350.1 sigma-70 family RNA polymerase sigma factor [Phycisphaerales bacterium]MCB9862943.1 sigma-70 family RNA polymerase sigma factor [Phycisphaerales bacterium]
MTVNPWCHVTSSEDETPQGGATRLLIEARDGNRSALDLLMPLIYEELRALAAKHLRVERPDHTLQPTELLHELYFKLVDIRRVDWQGRAHFLSMASRCIRRILIDHARSRNRQRRGGNHRRLRLSVVDVAGNSAMVDFLDLDIALDRLAADHPRASQVVELRYFGGLNMQEAADVLDVSERTAASDWSFAKAWLKREMRRLNEPRKT